MPRVKKLDLGMAALDELFMNDKERAENKLPKIFDIPLSEIDDFPGHPYRVLDDEDMQNLMESIKDRGVITPAMVRKKDDGRYEMISGHRRKHASERLGLETLRCEVVEVSRDEAIILMVDSNSQRSEIAPTDKGKAYKMKLEAIKRQQGERTDLTSVPSGQKLNGKTSREILAENSEDSNTQIQRYIRLTNLVPELQDFVDKGKMKMRPAVELSYLDEETQRDIVDRIDETDVFPSHAQAIRIRRAYEAGKIEAIAYDSSGKETARTTLVSATGKTSIKLTPETTNLCANGQDLCFLNIDLIGENGITKSSVDQELKIEISGPATLQGYGSARPNVEESFCNDTFKTFYGKSLAVIRAGYEPGTVTVKVSGKGLDTQELTLNIC